MPIDENIKENYLVYKNPMPLGLGISDTTKIQKNSNQVSIQFNSRQCSRRRKIRSGRYGESN